MLGINSKHNIQKGFTLIELLISMGLFVIVMVIAGQAFNTIVTQASRFSKMEESNIEGVVGLEVMRHDLEQMGSGLPWSWSARDSVANQLVNCTLGYQEAVTGLAPNLNDSTRTDSSVLADPLLDHLPRAFVAVNNANFNNNNDGTFNSAYIAVKGSTVGRAKAAQRWAYIPYNNIIAAPPESRPVTFASNNLQSGNMVVMVNSNPDNAALDHTLVVSPGGGGAFSVAFNPNPSSISDDYLPTDANQTYMVYGLTDDNAPGPRMPFNRADFFIGQNIDVNNFVPSFCAPNTGVLYKATVNHSDGKYTNIPLLDCVADMQVVMGWDTASHALSKDSSVSAFSSIPNVYGGSVTATPAGSDTSIKNWLSDPRGLREQLKLVKVYILAQVGKIDPNYTDPNYLKPDHSILVGDATDGISTAKKYILTAEQAKYHWKLYRIVVRPKNLVSNS